MRFLCLDFETSGIDPKANAPVQLGVSVCDNGEFTHSKEWVIAPPKDKNGRVTRAYDVFALKISGLTLKEIENGTPASVVVKELGEFVKEFASPSDMVVAFNASFDFAFYSELLFLAGQWNQHKRAFEGARPPLVGPWQCARLKCIEKLALSDYKLDTCANHFGLAREGERHGALEDAILAGKVYLEVAGLGEVSA